MRLGRSTAIVYSVNLLDAQHHQQTLESDPEWVCCSASDSRTDHASLHFLVGPLVETITVTPAGMAAMDPASLACQFRAPWSHWHSHSTCTVTEMDAFRSRSTQVKPRAPVHHVRCLSTIGILEENHIAIYFSFEIYARLGTLYRCPHRWCPAQRQYTRFSKMANLWL